MDIAADESSGAVWVASAYPKHSEDNNLTRLDPDTNRVVEEIPIESHSRYLGGAYDVAASPRCWCPHSSVLVTVVVLTAILPTLVAQRWFAPHKGETAAR